MEVSALRNARPGVRTLREAVALDDRHLLRVLREDPCGQETRETSPMTTA